MPEIGHQCTVNKVVKAKNKHFENIYVYVKGSSLAAQCGFITLSKPVSIL